MGVTRRVGRNAKKECWKHIKKELKQHSTSQERKYVKSPVELGLKTDCTGIYVETTQSKIDAMVTTGHLEFGIGDAHKDTIESRMRAHESSKNLSSQHYLLDSIPNPGYRDHALHREVRQNFATQLQNPDTGKRAEVFSVPVPDLLREEFKKSGNFDPIRDYVLNGVRTSAAKLNPSHIKPAVNLRNIQSFIIKKFRTFVRQKGLSVNFVCEIAPRVGKTLLFLYFAKLMQEMRKEFGIIQAMYVMAYGTGLSIKASYQSELAKYSDFSMMQFIDASDKDANEQYNQAIVNGKMPVVFISLNPEVTEKYEWINKLTGKYLAVLEETDFGTHTESQVKKVDYILENKTAMRINASGTNIGKLAKAFGKNAIDEIISIPYCMVEQDPTIPNVVKRQFHNMLFNPQMNKLLEGWPINVLPNINKILEKALSQEKFICALFQDLLGYQSIYGMNLSQRAGEIINHLMLFVNITNKSMRDLAKIIEKYCPEHKVLVLNGDYTCNKDAEGQTKEELIRLKNGYYDGRDKLIVITNMMGTRSYSIPEIQACLFMQEGGGVYPYMQRYSRCLTPDEHGNKKFGYIFDFAFDQSKTRNTIMSVGVDAVMLMRITGATFPEAVRQVLDSVNIKDALSGKWMDSNDTIKQFEDNNKLLEVANAHTRITIEDLTPEEIEVFGELAKRSSGSKVEKSQIDKVIATGKTFTPSNTTSGRQKKDPLIAIVEKAIRMINESATTVLALCNYQGENFLECLDIINTNPEMHREFKELYGVSPDTINRLKNRLEISTLDIIVTMSKYNDTQKNIESNSLAILKDDYELWYKILNHPKVKKFIKSEHCRKILSVAGGFGTEIDVLVKIYGDKIQEKIVYNDKYSFLCNRIKRKYPRITVMQGDFMELEFNMKFGVIVGNPPYQGNNDKGTKQPKSHNLWSKVVEKIKVSELLITDGYIAFVTPDSWMSPNSQVLKMFKDNSLIWVDTEVGKYFTVNSSFTAWVMQKNKNTSTALIDGLEVDLAKLQYLPRNFSKTFSIHDKVINSAHPKLDILCDTSCHSDHKHKNFSDTKDTTYKYETFHTNAQTKFCKKQSKDFTKSKIIWTTSGYFKPFYSEGNLGTSEVCQYILTNSAESQYTLSYLDSKLYKFIVNTGKWSGFLNAKVVSSLPKLASKVWTDAELYAHFGLTQDEIDYIEANVK